MSWRSKETLYPKIFVVGPAVGVQIPGVSHPQLCTMPGQLAVPSAPGTMVLTGGLATIALVGVAGDVLVSTSFRTSETGVIAVSAGLLRRPVTVYGRFQGEVPGVPTSGAVNAHIAQRLVRVSQQGTHSLCMGLDRFLLQGPRVAAVSSRSCRSC